MIRTDLVLAVPAGEVWEALVDLDRWPQWGPSVRGATLDGGGRRLRAGATGRVQIAVGVWLPFTVTEWEEGRRWAWRVAGIAATAHAVEPVGDGRTCRAIMEVPAWAPLYVPVCRWALGRLGRAASGP